MTAKHKLSDDQVRQILYAIWFRGTSKAELARRFGVTWTTIHHIECGWSYRHIPRVPVEIERAVNTGSVAAQESAT